MTRYSDWAARLEIWLHEQKGRKFQYGTWDCCLFVSEAIREMTGIDPAAEFRDQYYSASSAAGFIRTKYGARSVGAITETVAARFGMKEVPIRFASRGDVVLVKRPKDASLGLMALDGSRVIVLAGSSGMRTLPRFAATRAWSVKMSKFVGIIMGGLEIAAGVTLGIISGFAATPLSIMLISAGAGQIIAGLGTLLSKGPQNGFATTLRNPTAPWKVIYGRARVGGTIVYLNMWPGPGQGGGGSDQILDMVVVLAAHACQSVDVVLFDQQRVQIDTSARPGGAGPGAGTSFTPVQQTVKYTGSNPTRIKRVDGTVTVTLSNNIPFLIAGDRIQILNVPGDLTLNGIFQVADILSQIPGSPGSITFTYLSGGPNSDVVNAGWVTTLWADYGRKVYFEPILGNQTLGQTFAGMIGGTPLDGDMGDFVRPEHTGGVEGANSANPWTSNCSLQGKTAVFLRLHYSQQYFPAGLPQISFLVHGKNDIVDPRVSPTAPAYTENAALCIADFLSNKTWGFNAAYGTKIPIPQLIAAANVCDETVPLASSSGSPPITEPLWTCNGQFELTMRRGEILQNMLTACMGRLTYVGGQYVIWPAAWTGNSIAIGSNPGGGVIPLGEFAAIAAGPIRWKPTTSRRDLFNGVKGTYISQANKWMASDFPPYCQDSLHGYSGPSMFEGDVNLAFDGGDRLWLDIQLPFTISSRQAQQSAKVELLRRRASGGNSRGTGTLILNMVAYRIAPLDLMIATIPVLSWVAKQLEVTGVRFHVEEGSEGAGPSLGVEVDIQEIDPSIYAWSTSEELSPQGYKEPLIPGVGSFQFFATETVPGFTIPFPWEPEFEKPLVGDALYPGPVVSSVNEGKASFGLQVQYGIDAQGNATANLNIKGTVPANQLSSINPPQIICAPGTSGNLPPGRYIVAASALDTATPAANSILSVPVTVTIPVPSPPANNGSIEVFVSWPADSNGGEIYIAQDSTQDGYYFQTTLSASTFSATITDFDQSTPGAPDATFDHLAVAWKKVVHEGNWAQQVQAVAPTTITIAGSGMTTDQWANRVLSLLGKLDSTQELIILNMPVASSTASGPGSPLTSPPTDYFTLTIGPNSHGDQLPDLSTLLTVGDLVVMNFAATYNPMGFSDSQIANPYYPTGATGVEAGHVAMVLTGPDAGDAQPIASVSPDGFGNFTIIELASPWKIQPNDGDIVIIVEASWGPENKTPALPSPNRGALQGVIASPLVTNLAAQTWIFIVRAQTSDNDNGDDTYAPVRPIYIFGAQGTRTINSSQTMQPTDRILDVDASAGPVTITFLPFSQIANQSVYIQKIDSSANPVNWVCATGDFVNGISSGALATQWSSLTFYISGNG